MFPDLCTHAACVVWRLYNFNCFFAWGNKPCDLKMALVCAEVCIVGVGV